MSREYEDVFLRIVALLSAGVEKQAARKRVGLSEIAFQSRLRVAHLRLKRISDLPEEAASAVMWPRRHGVAPKRNYFPRYSTKAVTVERARALDAFHDSCQAVREACQDMDAFALTDLSDLIRGWRPANYNVTPDAQSALEAANADVSLYVWPEGLRLEWMKGHVNSIDLQMIRKKPKEGVVSGYLLCDVRDPASGYVCHEGSAVAVHLPSGDREIWREYLVSHRTGREPMRVRLSKSNATATLVLSPPDL